jgi:hypothetical protein
MSEPFYCGVQTRAARMYEDPEPAEHCESEVENEDDVCRKHDEDNGPDWDNIREERQEREREREADGYYDYDDRHAI